MTDNSKYRFVLTGSRDFTLENGGRSLEQLLDDHFTDRDGDIEHWSGAAIQHGGAQGFDLLAHEALRRGGWHEHTTIVKPDYDSYQSKPRMAPLHRNQEMVKWAAQGDYGAVIGMLPRDVHYVQMGNGGTAYTLAQGVAFGLDVFIYRFDRG